MCQGRRIPQLLTDSRRIPQLLTLPPLRKDRVTATAKASKASHVEQTYAAEGPSDEELSHWFTIIQNKMQDRFAEVRRAFRSLDKANKLGHSFHATEQRKTTTSGCC